MTQTLARLKAKRASDEGFTLIELMVVVLIIAVLLAIAIPTFIGARNSANDRAAQSSARNALTAAKVIQSNTGSYAGAATPANMTAVEPSLTYVTTASTGSTQVSVGADANNFVGVVRSATGTCFGVKDASGTVTYARSATVCTAPATASVAALSFSGTVTTGWTAGW